MVACAGSPHREMCPLLGVAPTAYLEHTQVVSEAGSTDPSPCQDRSAYLGSRGQLHG